MLSAEKIFNRLVANLGGVILKSYTRQYSKLYLLELEDEKILILLDITNGKLYTSYNQSFFERELNSAVLQLMDEMVI